MQETQAEDGFFCPPSQACLGAKAENPLDLGRAPIGAWLPLES